MVSNEIKVNVLRSMDNVIRMVSDEENGVFIDWITLHVPDEATDEDLKEFVENDDMFYRDACEFFARRVSFMLDKGDWNDKGYSIELFNSEAYDKGGIYNDYAE